jgi:DNA-binding transcriptional LysR family regulator
MQTRVSKYFVAVAQHRSMRDAAEALHVAQSALSRQVVKIEQEFGVALFERHPRGVQLTTAGEIFLRYARENLAQADDMRAEFDALKGLQRGKVRIHAIESLVHALLPRMITEFGARHPGITFDITVEGSERIIEAVREVNTDIGLTYFSQPGADIEVRMSASTTRPRWP